MQSENWKSNDEAFASSWIYLFHTVLSRPQLLKKDKNLIEETFLDEVLLHPIFMLLVCNNVTRKTKCYKKNTVLLNSQKGL